MVNTIVKVPFKDVDGFVQSWLLFMQPYHQMTEKEKSVFAAFLVLRIGLLKSINDESILDEVVLSENSRKSVREKCGISSQHFQVIMSKLRQKGMIVDNRLNSKFIPSAMKNNMYQLLFVFMLDDK